MSVPDHSDVDVPKLPDDTPAAGPPVQEASSVDAFERLWHRVKDHKLLQWALAYVAAALAIAHGQELVAHAYEWPEIVGRALIGVLGVGFPIALTLAWYHGHKGLKRFSAGELTIVSLLMLIGAGLLMVLVRGPSEHTPERAAAPPSVSRGVADARSSSSLSQSAKPRIAVMPFENLSPEPANAFFTDGMQEEILTALSNNAPGLEVISRTTMMTYRRSPKPVGEIAKELGATHVLEGSVRRDGNQVRVTLQLVDGRTDNHVWSKDYDRTLEDALTLQSEIAGEVADQLSVKVLQAAERAMPPTSSPEAYDLYLKAVLALDRPDMGLLASRAAFEEVDALLQRALKLDPDFALAHEQRARICGALFAFNLDVSDENVRHWRAELDTAARLAPDNPSVLASQGEYAYEVDHVAPVALQFFEQVESKGLVHPSALVGKTSVLMAMGRLDEAIALGNRVYAVDSHSLRVATGAVFSLWVARKTPELWHILTTGPSRATPLPDIARFYFKGEMAANLFLLPPGVVLPAVTLFDLLEQPFDSARNAGRLADFKTLIDKAPVASVRMGSFVVFPFPGVGQRPLAEFRGWTNLLLGDTVGAAQQSKPILDFVAGTKETRWNNWFLRMLTADAHLFSGDKPAAIAAAKEAMALFPCSLDAMRCLYPAVLGAQVLAWAGDDDAAVALLERLSLGTPGIAPAHAARDPMFTLPFAKNARYQALKAKLEAQMAATRLE